MRKLSTTKGVKRIYSNDAAILSRIRTGGSRINRSLSSKIYGACKPELKSFDVYLQTVAFSNIDTYASTSLVAGIVQGTADGQRVGREIRVKKIEFRAEVRDAGVIPSALNGDEGYRIDIIRDTQNNKLLINAAGQLKDSDYMGGAVADKLIGLPTVTMQERVKILRSIRKFVKPSFYYGATNVAASPLATNYHHSGSIRFPNKGLKIVYAGVAGTGADLPSDDIRVYLPCTSSFSGSFSGYFRVWYFDD